jgi:DNA ligase (NAD+)
LSAKHSITKDDYIKLIEKIRKHDHLYYSKAQPEISDYEYDHLLKELEEIEAHHPDWVLPTSPTRRVGESLTKGFKQVDHTVPMLSLANTYSKEELEDFVKRVKKWLEHSSVHFCTELKMDGVAITARYEKGVFVRGVTRGDGKRGDDITANMKTIRLLPLELSGKHIPDELEVRGEVFMTRAVFQELNAKKEEAGEELWANPRNAAAGSLKLLNPKEVAQRKLSVVFYAIAMDSSHRVKTQYDSHLALQAFGLPIFEEGFFKKCTTVDEVLAFADAIQKKRHALAYDIDGIVVKVDELKLHDELGATGRTPRWAVAYKFAPEQALTQILDITVQVGRTGVLTPVAELKPVLLAGSTISRATLHNQDEIARKDIRIGDWVKIEKGGDVIPKVVEVDLKKRPHSADAWKMPKYCPYCGSSVVHEEGEVAVRCSNKHCSEQVLRRIVFFASKDAMDIGHLGEKVVEHLFAKGFVKRVSDIYALTAAELSQLEGFKEKSVQNLLDSIEESRHCTLARFILALGIKYVGEGTAEVLASEAGDIDTLAHMTTSKRDRVVI